MADLQKKQADPGFWSNQENAKAVIDEANQLRAILDPFNAIAKGLQDAEFFFQLAGEEQDPAHREQAMRDAAVEADRIESAFQKLEMQSLLSGKLDSSRLKALLRDD